jgi:hypothetical protein
VAWGLTAPAWCDCRGGAQRRFACSWCGVGSGEGEVAGDACGEGVAGLHPIRMVKEKESDTVAAGPVGPANGLSYLVLAWSNREGKVPEDNCFRNLFELVDIPRDVVGCITLVSCNFTYIYIYM